MTYSSRLPAALALLLLVAGCDPVPRQESHAEQAANDACEKQADQTYLTQNRDLLSERSTTDTPFSTSGLPGVTSNGLSERYGRDEQLAGCLRENGQSLVNTNQVRPPGSIAPSPVQ